MVLQFLKLSFMSWQPMIRLSEPGPKTSDAANLFDLMVCGHPTQKASQPPPLCRFYSSPKGTTLGVAAHDDRIFEAFLCSKTLWIAGKSLEQLFISLL